jgi:NAD-dependent DNA ligase
LAAEIAFGTHAGAVIGVFIDAEFLVQAIDIIEVKDSSGPLSGMSFVLTGAMSKPRKDIEKRLIDCGAEVGSGVKKGLDYLVQSDPTSTSNKTIAANKYGVKVISEEEMWAMMGG